MPRKSNKPKEESFNELLNKIICGDVVETLKEIPDETVDLIVTSPPYNLKNSTGNGMKDGVAENGLMLHLLMAMPNMAIACHIKSMWHGNVIA